MRPLLAGWLLVPGLLSAQEKVNRGFAVDGDAAIRIQMAAGELRIIGWDRDSVAVTGTIPPGGGTWYGGGRGRAAKLGVEARDPSGAGPGATLEVRLPRGARLWIKTVTATVRTEGVTGEVDAVSVGGSLTVQGPSRVLSLETIDGAVTVDGLAGVVRARTGSGTLSIRGTSGDVTASSVGGVVDVSVDRLDRGRLESVTGQVRFTGNIGTGGALEAESHAADVILRFVGEVDAEFTLASVGGTVANRLGPKGASTSTPKGKPVTFLVGEGGAQVSARSFKGAVIVTR